MIIVGYEKKTKHIFQTRSRSRNFSGAGAKKLENGRLRQPSF